MKNFIILATLIFLCQCKKDSGAPYSNKNIVMDNAQAALYFHTVFREAENTWAFIDSINYKNGTYYDRANGLTNDKELVYNEKTETVTISYQSWVTNYLHLSGSMNIKIIAKSYRQEGKTANVLLSDFSINGQRVEGVASIKFNKTVEKKDNYTYTLLDGAAIYEHGRSKSALISCTISNGLYERTEGNETFAQDDDVWLYSGVMTGLLRNDPNQKYTNTVNPALTYGENINAKIKYSMDCQFAEQGLSHITFLKRPTIGFVYGCFGYYFSSTEHID